MKKILSLIIVMSMVLIMGCEYRNITNSMQSDFCKEKEGQLHENAFAGTGLFSCDVFETGEVVDYDIDTILDHKGTKSTIWWE